MVNQQPSPISFHEFLEKDIQRLSKEIQGKRETPEFKNLPEREIVKQSLNVFAPVQPSAVPPSASAGGASDSSLPGYLQGAGVKPEIKFKVERLLDLTWHQGLRKGIKESQKQLPFIQDAYHDALVDKLIPELKQRGIIK